MKTMFEAGVEHGREQGLDQAMDLIMAASELLGGDELKVALDLHRLLMGLRFPHSHYAAAGAK